MEKKLLGAAMILLGVLVMFYAGYIFINGRGNVSNIVQVIIYTISGSTLLFGGINIVVPQASVGKAVDKQMNAMQRNTQ